MYTDMPQFRSAKSVKRQSVTGTYCVNIAFHALDESDPEAEASMQGVVRGVG
jgi:hypothetical protein